jgi:putative FmdB family regulatory protein
MPTYEFQALDPAQGCDYCREGFEVILRISDPPLPRCPRCGQPVRRVLFAPAVVIKGTSASGAETRIRDYEREGKWSHAAELADKESEKTKREDLKTRALENYKKAGYNFEQ